MNISSEKMLAILSGRFSVGEEYEPGLFLFRGKIYTRPICLVIQANWGGGGGLVCESPCCNTHKNLNQVKRAVLVIGMRGISMKSLFMFT